MPLCIDLGGCCSGILTKPTDDGGGAGSGLAGAVLSGGSAPLGEVDVNAAAMAQVIRDQPVHGIQGNGRKLCGDFFGEHPAAIRPQDVLDAHASAGHANVVFAVFLDVAVVWKHRCISAASLSSPEL